MSTARRSSAPLLDVSVCELPPECLVAVSGELDMSTAPQLARTLRGLDRSDQIVTLDLRALTFIDVAGVRGIQDARRVASEDGRQLLILGPPRAAARVLELTGTLNLLS